MSIDRRGRRASDGVRAATEGVNVMAQLTDLQHQDKTRHRNGAALAAGLIVLVVGGAGWAATSFINNASDVVPAIPPTPSVSAAPQLLDYGNGDIGLVIKNAGEVDQLTGAPEEFKSFVAGLVTELNKEAKCDASYRGVRVQKIRTDGFAVGGVNSCGGYVAIWATVDGTWKQIEGAQELWDCAVLKKYAVPSDIAGDQCYDYSGTNKEEPYNQP